LALSSQIVAYYNYTLLTSVEESDVMRAIEKLWSVVYNINEVSKITPSNEPCSISPRVFEHIAKSDVDKIFRKLSKDNKVINLINVPETENIVHADDDVRDYDYIVGVLPAFEAFFEDTYRLYHQGIHKLGAKNFLAIHELVLDIEQEIEMSDSNTVTVELLNRTMRFSGLLFPQDTPHFRDAYCELRMKSASYLKRHGAIKSYNLIGEGSGWDAKIEIKFDAYAFDGFADKTKFRYKEEFHKSANGLVKGFRKKGVFINKESKPQVEHPDDTASEPYEEPVREPAVSAPTPEKVNVHPLQPSHYHDKTGKLAVSPTVDVSIAVRGKVIRKSRTKYDQCHLMSCLFKSVNTLNNGVTFSTFLGVKYDKNTKTHIRKIRNTVDEINKKVAEKTTAKKLIFIQGEKIILNHSYLKN